MSASENLLAHHALESVFERLYATLDGARFERRSDLIVALCPAFPIPQFNGAWVAEDSQAAVDAMPRGLPRSRRRARARGFRLEPATTVPGRQRSISDSPTQS